MFSKIPTLITQYFSKQGIDDFTQLDAEERATYDEWYAILEAQPSVESLAKFVEKEIPNLQKALQEAVLENNDRKAILATARLQNYEALYAVITAPDRGREVLEAHITSLISKLP